MTTREDILLSNQIYKEYKSQSTGSDGYTRFNPFVRDIIGTSGVMAMADDLGAHWFLDIVASYMPQIKKIYQKDDSQYFFVCRLSKLEGDKALFTIDDGNEGEPIIKQEIPYTDSTMNIRTYLQTDGTYWCLMIPSEY